VSPVPWLPLAIAKPPATEREGGDGHGAGADRELILTKAPAFALNRDGMLFSGDGAIFG